MAITTTHSRMIGDLDAGSTYLQGTIGTAANNVVQLDGTAKLPAVDGSQLTGISTGGGWTPIASQTLSADSEKAFTTGITDTYQMYRFIGIISDMTADASGLKMTISDDTGSSYKSSGYDYAYTGYTHAGETKSTNDASAADIRVIENYDTDSACPFFFDVTGINLRTTNQILFKTEAVWFQNVTTNHVQRSIGSGRYGGALSASVDAIKFAPSSGTFTGNIYMLGMKLTA